MYGTQLRDDFLCEVVMYISDGFLFIVMLYSGGDSHLEISVILMLGHPLYTREYRLGARAWQGFGAILSM
jgi:hypothetical protein